MKKYNYTVDSFCEKNKNFSIKGEKKMSEKKVQLVANERVFEGLAKQNMLFHQCVFELVDNAMAAAKENVKINVNITFEPIEGDDDNFYLYVSDNGTGMDGVMLGKALQLGQEPSSNSRLNEHGFGLKNSLATLSGGNGEWTLWTRKNKKGNVLRVDGPFASTMIIKDEKETRFPDKQFIDKEDVSTVIMTRVKKSFATTVQGRGARAKSLELIRTYMLEHLGVAYRGYLQLDKELNETKAKISVNVGTNKQAVGAIEVPIADMKTKYFDVDLGGKTYKVTYVFGTLDDVKRDSLVKGNKAKYYYQGNTSTQGIDIRLGDRVIATRQLDTIWRVGEGKPLTRDNHYNQFVGELKIPDLPRGVLTTINNKTDFNLDDPDWTNIFDILNEEEYKPIKDAKALGEKELRDQWIEVIKAANPKDIVLPEKRVWDSGVRIDVYRKIAEPDNSVIIYELKVGTAAPLNLYQLKMYWDGLVKEGEQPSQGVLLVEDYGDLIEQMANDMNSMTPPKFKNGKLSAPYYFTVEKHKDKKIGRKE